jgi:hypothetical protein
VTLLVAAGLGGDDAPAVVDSRERQDEPNTIRAAFAARSYAAGDDAVLSIRTDRRDVRLRVFQAGPEGTRTQRADVITGVPVTPWRQVDLRAAPIKVHVGNWRSGVYFVRLEADGGRLGFAPFVLRPRVLGTSRVAVVVPTNTWQAYNFRDVDGDGVGDTWYADSGIPCVDLQRPYLERGAFQKRYRGFLRWFEHGGRRADFLSDDDLDRVGSGDVLAREYDFVLFSSHEEYVTPHVYDITTRFRDLGGNLAFLSANTFFYRVERRQQRICRTGLWKSLGRDDARLVGVHYVGWWQERYASRPYIVRGADRAPWLFEGTGLRNGDSTGGAYGVEIDSISRTSPRGTFVLADIRDQFGPGLSATMTYYETARGARVFAAGTMGFERPQTPAHRRMLDNLWDRLVRP